MTNEVVSAGSVEWDSLKSLTKKGRIIFWAYFFIIFYIPFKFGDNRIMERIRIARPLCQSQEVKKHTAYETINNGRRIIFYCTIHPCG